jgi:hypothetical protein
MFKRAVSPFFVVLFFISGTQANPVSTSADTTLSLEVYQDHGLPDLSAPWGPEELRRASLTLHAIANEDLQMLPSLNDSASRVVFERLVAPENFQQYSSAPPRVQATNWARMAPHYNSLMQLYTQAYESQFRYRTEIIDLSGAVLGMLHAMINHLGPLADLDQRNSTADMAGADVKRIRSGSRRMKQGATMSVVGAFTMMANTSFLSPSLVHRLMDHLAAPLPDIAAFVDAEQRQRMLMYLNDAQDAWSNDGIDVRMNKMRNVIVGAD